MYGATGEIDIEEKELVLVWSAGYPLTRDLVSLLGGASVVEV